MDHRNDAQEQWLQEHEARLTALEAESKKLDRLVYKLFKRLPRQTHEEKSSPSGEAA